MLRSVRFWIVVILLAAAVFIEIDKRIIDPQKISPAPERRPAVVLNTPPEVSVTSFYDAGEEYTQPTEVPSAAKTDIQKETEEIEYDASVPYISESKVKDITEKMNEVSKYSNDLIGWIYIADSDIDYPIVQGTDNQYYLHHTPDGRQNTLGTIFLDCKCRNDFSDSQNILFGHNMQYGMFGDIRSYKEKGNFDSHRYGWLFTRDSIYRIDFYALVIVSAFHEVYDIPADNTEWLTYIKDNSLHYTETEFSDDDRYIALSTCASDFNNARALLTGRLVRIGPYFLSDSET